MKQFIWLALVLILAITATVSADIDENDYLKASDRCVRREHLSSAYKAKFDRFDFPDEPAVHSFVHCVWTELAIWNDRTGVNVEKVAGIFKDRANEEILIPILSDCNRNSRNAVPTKWCYANFKCILTTRVGQWFKDDVGQKITENHVQTR